MKLQNQGIIVTGGAGFIGSHVVDQLVAAGNRVTVIDEFSTGKHSNIEHHLGSCNVRVTQADIRDAQAMMDAVREADAVLHMAVASLRVSLSDPMSVHEINTTGTLNVCRAALQNGVRRVVYVSSSEVYGSAEYAPMDENHPLNPTTVYGASKAAGELYALSFWRTYGLETTVVRPFNTYGPREHADGTSAEVIPRFAMRVLAGQPPVIFGSGQQTRDFTWVEDTARGIIQAAACDELVGSRVNIARGQEVSIAAICGLVLRSLGREDLAPITDQERPGDVTRHFADITRAREYLDFQPRVDIETGIERYTGWLKEQNPDVDGWLRRERVRNW